MTRIVKDYDERHAEFLKVSQSLFFSKGYEQTSVQSIINEMGVAKGTFYHYFRSKVELLDALVRDMYGTTFNELKPMIASENLTATQKLEKLFQHINDWHSDNREFLIASAKALHQEANTLLRIRMEKASSAEIIPLLGDILQQGIHSGEFSLKYPDETAEIIIQMKIGINNSAVALIIAESCTPDEVEKLTQQLQAFRNGVARLVGVDESQLDIIDFDELMRWLPVDETAAV